MNFKPRRYAKNENCLETYIPNTDSMHAYHDRQEYLPVREMDLNNDDALKMPMVGQDKAQPQNDDAISLMDTSKLSIMRMK